MNLKPCIPSELKPPLNVTTITDRVGICQMVNYLSTLSEFGLDIETNVVPTFFDRRIRTIQAGTRDKQYVIDLLAFTDRSGDLEAYLGGYYRGSNMTCSELDYMRDALRPLFETDKLIKVGHNLDFEYETIKWNLGLRLYGLYDTYLAEKVLNSGLVNFMNKQFWGLDNVVGRYCGMLVDKSEQKTFDLHSPLTESQITYGALDIRFPLAIKGAQIKRIEALGLGRTLQIENDAIPASGDIHLNGMLLDVDKWMTEVNKTREIHTKNVARLDELFIPIVGVSQKPHTDDSMLYAEKLWREEKDKTIRPNYRNAFNAMRRENTKWIKASAKYEGQANVQYGSPAQLLAAVRKAGIQIINTNDEVLETMEGDIIIDAIREFRTTEKVISSYDEKYIEQHVNKNTGRIHPNFNQLGAETGRTSCSKPNMQNINKDSAWRSCFVARKGRKIITADYAGCELRILAEVSGEKVWIDAFNSDWDVHSVGAEMVFGKRWKDAAEEGCAYYSKHKKCKCKQHEILRDYIKSINFGIAYGMEAKKLARKIKVTVKEAQTLLADYRKTFPAVTAWLEKAGKDAQTFLRSVTLAGRLRFYPKPDWNLAKQYATEDAKKDNKPLTNDMINRKFKSLYSSIERQGKNSPIQGTNGDMIKLAMGCGYDSNGVGMMWHDLEPKYGALLLNSVHDECIVEAMEENAEEVHKFVTDCMFRAANEFLTKIKGEVEGHIRDCWSKK